MTDRFADQGITFVIIGRGLSALVGIFDLRTSHSSYGGDDERRGH